MQSGCGAWRYGMVRHVEKVLSSGVVFALPADADSCEGAHLRRPGRGPARRPESDTRGGYALSRPFAVACGGPALSSSTWPPWEARSASAPVASVDPLSASRLRGTIRLTVGFEAGTVAEARRDYSPVRVRS